MLGLLTPETCSLSVNDLKLLTNWCTTTYQSVTQNCNSEHFWRIDVPREALGYPALLDSILALSALQLAYHRVQDDVPHLEYLNAAQTHWIKAHTSLGHEVSSAPDMTSCTALFAQCNAEIIFSFAFFHLIGSSSSSSALDDLYHAFLQVQGPTSVLIDLVENAPGRPMLSLVTQQGDAARMPNTFAVAIIGLKRLNAGLGSQQQRRVYSEAIDQLDSCLGYVARSSDPGVAGLWWILKIPSEYLDLLKDREPMALIILAHYCVVLYSLRKRWWMGDWGVRVLYEICNLLGRDRLATISWAIDATNISWC